MPVLVGPEVGRRRGQRLAAQRAARARWAAWSAAFSQCSMRTSSTPGRGRAAGSARRRRSRRPPGRRRTPRRRRRRRSTSRPGSLEPLDVGRRAHREHDERRAEHGPVRQRDPVAPGAASHVGDAGPGAQLDAGALGQRGQPPRDLRAEHAEQRVGQGLEHHRGEAARVQAGRDLGADEPAADHDDRRAGLEALGHRDERRRVGAAAQGRRRAGARERRARARASRSPRPRASASSASPEASVTRRAPRRRGMPPPRRGAGRPRRRPRARPSPGRRARAPSRRARTCLVSGGRS